MTEHQNVKKKAIEPTGPFAPPRPSEAEQDEHGEPMAVANDKQTTQGEGFAATTAPNVPGSGTPHGRDVRDRHDENLRHETQEPGFSEPDAHGFRHLEEEEAEDQPSGRVAAHPPREIETDEDEGRAE